MRRSVNERQASMIRGRLSEMTLGMTALSALAALWGCPAGEVTPPGSSAAGAGPGAQSAVASGSPKAPFASDPWHIPVGPKLPIMPGKGLGPIRFGARLDTVERLMGEPCAEKREEPSGTMVCRYAAQAVEFYLEGGAVTKIHAHRLARPFKPDSKADFGIFNGSFVEGASFGMLVAGAQESLGKPKAVRKVEGENAFSTIEVHEYDGFLLEYDRLGPERVVLGGVILTAPAPK
jgi:hypothetical protein